MEEFADKIGKENQSAIEGELLEVGSDESVDSSGEEQTVAARRNQTDVAISKTNGSESENSKYYIQFVFLPLIFITVTLLGGLRIGIKDSEFIFLRPALSSLIFAVLLLLLFFRADLISFEGWFSEKYTTLRNIVNGAVLLTLFTASVQVFNSLIPEQGLPFWVIGFCFLWTLWNNLFAEFTAKRLL